MAAKGSPVAHPWTPIEPLSQRDRRIDLAVMAPLYDAWREARRRLEESSPTELHKLNQRLVRSLSIETGILERLYDLDRGTTEALVAHGFVEDLVTRSSTDIEPARLIDILRDQEAAIQLVMDCVASNRDLSKSVMHELHSTLTRHQETTTAIDQFGVRKEIPLRRGQFKKHPNNPRRGDGSVHEYCPPLQVEPEIEKLLEWRAEYEDEDPILVAAWFHHRFTQIHPHQDGNGRVVRALLTLLMVRSELMPLVIDRDRRVEYIESLEKADRGDLSDLVQLFAGLERSALLRALSVDADAEIAADQPLTQGVIDQLAARFDRRKRRKEEQLRQVDQVAESLRARARQIIEDAFNTLKRPVAEVAEIYRPEIYMADGGPDQGNAHWYKKEVIRSGRESGKFVNFNEAHYFVKGSFVAGRDRLVFVTSFHHVGRELSGIAEVTAFALLESRGGPDESAAVDSEYVNCSLEPFVITWNTSVDAIGSSFDGWLDQALAVAIKEFGDRL